MIAVLIFFVLSLLICCAIAYILGLFWFSDMRNRKIRSFFALGIEIFIWTLLNAVTMICDYQYFPVIYTLRMTFVCIIPFGVSWFILNFTGSSLRDKKVVRIILIALPLADVLCMITNPLHYLYFQNYAYPMPARAMIFWVHIVMDFTFVIITFIVLIRYIIKGSKSNPLLILTGIAMLIPYSMNMLYTFGKITFPHDTTPIGFFITFILFVYVSYRSGIINFKISLFSSTMDAIDDIIILLNKNLVIMDANQSAVELFSNFPMKTGRTKAGEFLDFMGKITRDFHPDYLIENMRIGRDTIGDCTILLKNGEERTYSTSLHSIFDGKNRTGYIYMMSDISSYRDMITQIKEQRNRLSRQNG